MKRYFFLLAGALVACGQAQSGTDVAADRSAAQADLTAFHVTCGTGETPPPVDQIQQTPITNDPATGMSGVELLVNIGDIAPEDAAAVWWDLPSQVNDFFPGSTYQFLSGDESQFGFVFQISAQLPGVGTINQTARYTANVLPKNQYAITVDAFVANALWTRGLGKYTFRRANCQTTLLDIVSLYNPLVPGDELNAAALASAQAHQQRYLGGRTATAQEQKYFFSALGEASCQ